MNDPTIDVPNSANGATQIGPSVAETWSPDAANQIVVLWMNGDNASGTNRFRYAVSASDPISFVQHGAPTPPAGWEWYLDPVVRGPVLGNQPDGNFYIAGAVISDATPRHIGVAFVRGVAQTPRIVSFEAPQLIKDFGAAVGTVALGTVTLAVDPNTDFLYCVYTPTLPTAHPYAGLYFVRSMDRGTTWTSTALLDPDSTRVPLAPRVSFGVNPGEVTFAWERTGPSGDLREIATRTSTDWGATLSPVTVAETYAEPSQSNPALTVNLAAFDMLQVDAMGSQPGTTLLANKLGMEMTHDVFPDPTSAPAVTEVEPNGSPATATHVNVPGVVVRGIVSPGAAADTDYYEVSLVQGQAVSIYADSIAPANCQLEVTWLGTVNHAPLTRGYPDSFAPHFYPGRLGFVAPVTGTYHLRLAALQQPTSYRLRIAAAATPFPSARDAGDIGHSIKDPLAPWTGAQIQTPFGSMGSFECDPTLVGNSDGAVYCTFTDFSPVPGGASSRRVIRRSADAGATWSVPLAISSANCDWALSRETRRDAAVHGSDVATDGVAMYMVWSDARSGDSDIYLSKIDRRIVVDDVTPFTASVAAGSSVTVGRVIRNLDVVQPFPVLTYVNATGPGFGVFQSLGQIDPGQAAAQQVTINVPGNATPGVVPLLVQFESADGIHTSYDSRVLQLTVLSPTQVAGVPTARLALEAVSPNPMHGAADVHYSLARAGSAELALYGVDGRLVRTLASGEQPEGPHHVAWDGRDASGRVVGAGAYFVVLRAEGQRLVRRVAVIR